MCSHCSHFHVVSIFRSSWMTCSLTELPFSVTNASSSHRPLLLYMSAIQGIGSRAWLCTGSLCCPVFIASTQYELIGVHWRGKWVSCISNTKHYWVSHYFITCEMKLECLTGTLSGILLTFTLQTAWWRRDGSSKSCGSPLLACLCVCFEHRAASQIKLSVYTSLWLR